MNQAFLKVLFSEAVRVITFPIRLMPIKKKRILFTGLTGGKSYDYSCNPKYVYEYMKTHFPGQYEYVWAVADKEKYAFLKEEGVKLVKHFTVSSFPMLLTSKVIVTNGSYAPWFPFRKQQYVINTWHGGGAYKKVENEKPDADWATRKRAEFCAKNIDLFVASCKVQEDNMIRKTFLYKGEVLRAGTPRNDKLVNGDIADMAKKVREKYHIPKNGKIVLYAPTYRRPEVPVVFDSDYLLKELDNMQFLKNAAEEKEAERKKETEDVKWYFMCRYHRYQDENMNVKVTGQHVIDVMDYPDMQELLCAADMLITDYSSCVWDYAFLKRPCFLYTPDKKEYIKNTGFYVGLEKWPFSQAETMEKLLQNISGYQPEKRLQAVSQHLEELGNYESGACNERLSEIIQGVCDGVDS
ncbi:MAG: CDP-glycerol glycerophosphotransferase family protein [Clostridiales bacterium]|nr:CDP-glycerol glycerophosphotransferase family protein [Clostridiales bacterium]